MSIWLEILLKFLPLILEFIKNLLEKKKTLSVVDTKRLNYVLWYMDEVGKAAVKVGASKGGVQP